MRVKRLGAGKVVQRVAREPAILADGVLFAIAQAAFQFVSCSHAV